MSLRERAAALRRTIDRLLATGGDIAVPILTAVNAAADVCPPLKSATSGALFIFGEVKKFKENKREWADFGKYVVDTVAEVVAAIKSFDESAEEAKSWVESATKLDGTLQEIKSKIDQKLAKVEKRLAFRNTFSHFRDSGRIDGLKKDLDKALAAFQLRTNLRISLRLSTIEDGRDTLQGDSILGRLRYPDVAHYDSTQACLKGTRVDLTEHIMAWCCSTGDSQNRLMLMTAVAGAGKTSIAHTIAENCKREATLLLAFFFKAGEQSRPDCLFSGIAQALANRDPDHRNFIVSALRKDPTLSTAPFTMQFKELVASPLLHKPPPSYPPMVVIIDALDECDKEAFEPLANILREEVPRLPSSIKFFVTSRQFDLVNRFLSAHCPIDRLTINLSDETNVQDCATYIRSQLQMLKNFHPDVRHKLQDEGKIVQKILERAGGLFVWISTIFSYMKMANKDPMKILETLLDTGTKRPAISAEGMMDRLYTSILKKCDWEDEDFAHDYPLVMGAIFVAQQPLSVSAWDTILSPFLKSSIQYTLAELAPLLSGVEDCRVPIRILHQSFRDFIVDRIDPQSISLRCGPVDTTMENAKVALRCAEILNQDLCSVENLGLIKNLSEQDELPRIPPANLSEHFHYACRHLSYHLSEVQEPPQALQGSICVFFSQHATRWVEVCVRMEGYISISVLLEWHKWVVDQRSKGAINALANVLTQLQPNLEFSSRFQEAYEAANDSVALCRHLVAVDSGSYMPDLANSLNNICNALCKLGRHPEALPFIEEGVKLYRQLVAVHSGWYTPDLARSLNSLYLVLSDLGRHSEALPFIEESVKILRRLVAIHPGSYNPNLALSLNNLCRALSSLKRHKEALSFIEESIKLQRQLVAAHPESHTPDLAMSLNNLLGALSSLGRHSEALPFIEESVRLYPLSNLGRHSEALPFIEECVKIRRQLVAVLPGSYTPKLALSLSNLYSALSKLGRHSEALLSIEESVKILRQLIAVHPGSYNANLALSLNNLCRALSRLGRHSEALPFIEESVELYRQLVAVHPRSYTPDLAMSLNNLYLALSNLGRHCEALPFIEESVEIRRELVVIHPASYRPKLALSLSNLYSALSELGRHHEALPFIEESVKIRRQLAAVHPGSYTPDVARSLNILYLAHYALQQHSEALPFIKEGVTLYRQLAAAHPGSYASDLARSLNILYLAHSDLRRYSEALPFIEESVKLYRKLLSVHPGSYAPYLALSLNNLRDALSNLGQHSEALPFIEESVKLYRQLVVVHPESYTPGLALSLNNLYDALSKLGRHSEALPFIEESLKIRQQLVAIHPRSYTSHLALSLNNLYYALSNLERHSEALPFIEESVKLYRQLVAVHPGSHTPDLATSLNNLHFALSELGRHSEALQFIEESVQLYHQLAAVHPALYTPDLTDSLETLRDALSNIGHHPEVQMIRI
ncbi:uncharacterized protein EI90DRAFT_3134318 [Cantharellus anzutake]|uniref:uncharacterized protein n=1 Tax=Cantharellus anzutake TaxID=1750568 RepID=UPI001904CE75|nr:uncharacterized protein EI90DRAFT_3134318 [Cantharellus anzutake]KAF8316498.1 hypothetical protein EI90DRAFT_3134318 [Cantharellus anzutake]